jgi:hypothetical protein
MLQEFQQLKRKIFNHLTQGLYCYIVISVVEACMTTYQPTLSCRVMKGVSWLLGWNWASLYATRPAQSHQMDSKACMTCKCRNLSHSQVTKSLLIGWCSHSCRAEDSSKSRHAKLWQKSLVKLIGRSSQSTNFKKTLLNIAEITFTQAISYAVLWKAPRALNECQEDCQLYNTPLKSKLICIPAYR